MKTVLCKSVRRAAWIVSAAILTCSVNVAAGEWSGYVAGEARVFTEDPAFHGQHHDNLSVYFEPEYYHAWDERRESFTFTPFVRLDQHDPERTHVDIRELYWEKAARSWELRVGIRKVFWGVTESQHLVDIVNQTDLVENPDGEDKLGQPMVNLAIVHDWGTLDLFILPGFRERTFPGRRGRLRPSLPIDTDHAEYESGAEQYHVDWAARWAHSISDWDLGISHFWGTSREPRLVPRPRGMRPTELVPFYDQINQTGADVQYTKGGWLWKLEAITRSGQDDTFTALTGGFEYTLYGAFETDTDIGFLTEYLYDDRGNDSPSPFENDIFAGTRIGMNDEQSTEMLAGAIVDPDSGATTAILEASRRLGENWKLNIETRIFIEYPETDPAATFKRDDYIQMDLAWYF